tara:strand:+ start:63970 stop:65628 length:1659 start_codon:yes stop_codon:yes gene_type:complete
MSKTILHNEEARSKIMSGIEKLCKTVSVTMGPKGRNVIVGKFAGAPTITKDGVSVAREVVLEDPVEELGCQLVKEVAGRTADVAGDGTTTATVLAHEILKNGLKLISAGYSPLDIRDGIEWAKTRVIENLADMSRPVDDYEDLLNIASISANNDKVIGKTIADAFDMVGWTGTVDVVAFPGQETTVRYVDGVELPSGFITPAFLNGEKSEYCTLEKCRILICDRDITHLSDSLELLNQLSKENTPLLIVAKDVKLEALQTIIANKGLGRLNCVCIKIPATWRNPNMWLEDLSVLTCARVYGETTSIPMSEATIQDLGYADKVVVGRSATKILGSRRNEEAISEKLVLYSKDLEKLIGDKDRFEVKKRIAMLTGKAAVISVGYSTELELREKGDRYDDAMAATKAAISEGVVPGGGVALLRAANNVSLCELEGAGLIQSAKILLDACKRPLHQICINAGVNEGVVVNEILSNSDAGYYGYNAANDSYGDMYEMGIIDPAKVARSALQNAASIASLIITTESVMAVDPNSENPSGWQPPAGWRPPSDTGMNHKY